MNVLANDAMSFWRSRRDIARNLSIVMLDAFGAEAERGGIVVSWLQHESRPVDGAPVEAGRSSSLQAAAPQPELLQGLAEKNRIGLS